MIPKTINEPIEALYRKYKDDALIQRLEEFALWTIPSVFPRDLGKREYGNSDIEHDYQSMGSLLVNRLASKLAGTLFPVNTPFFKLEGSDEYMQQIADAGQSTTLIKLETAACRRLFFNASYSKLVQVLRLLIITGECLILRKDSRLQVFSLKTYTLHRNNVGDVLDIVIKEPKYVSELDDDVVGKLDRDRFSTDTVDLYTRVHRTKTNKGQVIWRITQEIDGIDIGTLEEYPEKLCPYIPVTWNYVNGDAYGRGYVEEYAGDFAKVSELSQKLTEYELQSLKVLFVYNPASAGFDLEYAVNSQSGDWIQGDPSSIAPMEFGSFQKIQQILADINVVAQRLNTAFMYTGNVREGERINTMVLYKRN